MSKRSSQVTGGQDIGVSMSVSTSPQIGAYIGLSRHAPELDKNERLSCHLCVDLDGTIVRTDTLIESIVALAKRNILYLFMLPIWVLKGRAYLKDQIAQRIDLRADVLPYNEAVLDYLKNQRSKGRRLPARRRFRLR